MSGPKYTDGTFSESGRGVPCLFIAVGNPMRGDDGVAHRVIEMLAPCEGSCVAQLTPEMAVGLSSRETVVIIDADTAAHEVRLEQIVDSPPPAHALTHSFPPDALVALARRLYGFSGVAWLCRVPARAFGAGERLSAVAEASAHTAARLLATTFSGPQLKDPDRLP